jgi:radical SAM superfamily enzyme YgiQ (UPF0313 family)
MRRLTRARAQVRTATRCRGLPEGSAARPVETVNYQGHIIRPPSEADSILLEVTIGCSHHRCSFCGAYQADRFRIKDEQTIAKDIAYAARHFPDRQRLFLLHGDALVVPAERLCTLLGQIRQALPQLTRVGSYANAQNIAHKSDQELAQLHELGLKVVHLGLESGDDDTLRKVGKYGDAAFIVEQGRRVRAAGIKLFVTVLLGIAGPQRSLEHARLTGDALTRLEPDYVGALSLMLIPGTELFRAAQAGEFVLARPEQLLVELRELLAHTHMSRGLFYANHASNYLPLRARLPRDKAATLALLDQALSGRVRLRPEWRRGL